MISVELMNMNDEAQEVILTASFQFVSGVEMTTYQFAQPFWLDVAGCGGSDLPAADKAHFEYSSPSVEFGVEENSRVAYLSNHLHDGGERLEVRKNGIPICDVKPSYGELEGTGTGMHISRIPSCADVGNVVATDAFDIKVTYDTRVHPPMQNADGSLEPVMGIAIAYVVPESPQEHPGTGTISVVVKILIALIAAAAILQAALWMQKVWPEWSPWRQAQRRYQNLQGEGDDEDDEV
jgi:hypothetical protein